MTASLTLAVLQLPQLQPALHAHFGALGLALPVFSMEQDLPARPGVYVWCSGDEQAVAYIGSAASLKRRLSDELRWIAAHDPETGWAPSVVHTLKQLEATPHWVEVDSHEQARLLERRLIEWHRVTVGCAPLLVGWNPKADSDQGQALSWARRVWKTDPDRYRSWGDA